MSNIYIYIHFIYSLKGKINIKDDTFKNILENVWDI